MRSLPYYRNSLNKNITGRNDRQLFTEIKGGLPVIAETIRVKSQELANS